MGKQGLGNRNLGLQFSIYKITSYKFPESKVPNPSYPTKWQMPKTMKKHKQYFKKMKKNKNCFP